MSENTIEIKTAVFEGPMELLLQLIEKRKLFINDISLSEVADEYISYMNNIDIFPVEQVSHFILIASTLVLIKSKSLLPNLSLTDEEQSHIEDLESRLELYRQYKDLSGHVSSLYSGDSLFLPFRRPTQKKEVIFTPGESTTLKTCVAHIIHVISQSPQQEDIPQATVKKVVSLQEVLERMIKRVEGHFKTSFYDFAQCSKNTSKQEVIVSFIAMLELARQGIIQVQQSHHFKDIYMEAYSVDVPRY